MIDVSGPMLRFMQSARGKSTSEILKNFLRFVIFTSEISESGSIVVWDKSDLKLHLFNEDNFLFEEKYLDPSKHWKSEFGTSEGMAGLAFTTQTLQYNNDVSRDKRNFVDEGEPIQSIVCVPVIIPSRARPFGVASFHNGSPTKPFDEEARRTIEMAVHALDFALGLAEPRLKNIFIVHGRDKNALRALKEILKDRGVIPMVLGEEPGTGAMLVEKIDEILSDCSAGFVLLTPDDLGKFKSDPKLQPRARQNVIFEGGWLTALFRERRRIAFLKTAPGLEWPSDIEGIKYEDFNIENPNERRIEAILTEWGINWTPPVKH